ncbi:hypothetical protein DL93DRAFT_633515 [Clavulina sp. PMI_390]|nr:hypothetical protein DL93DRAFT_633515 [Clavulina sp. PMI_390]
MMPLDGSEGIQMLPFDILEHILRLLDPCSLFQLASTCRYYRDILSEDTALWSRALREFSTENCLAPHSFSHSSFSSPSAARRIISRPRRILEAISNEDRRLDVRPLTLTLIPDTPPGSIKHIDGVLLPGGRWYLSLAVPADPHTMNPACRVQIFCWDLLEAVDSTITKPSARHTLELPTGRPRPIEDIMKARLYEDGETVVIACASIVGHASSGYLTKPLIQVLLLVWDAQHITSFLSMGTLFAEDLPFIANREEHFGICEYSIVGDVLVIEGIRNIAVWNWKLDTIGILDLRPFDWARGRGFTTVTLPPFIYISPRDGQELIILELPDLRPRRGGPAKLSVPPRSLTHLRLPGVASHIISSGFVLLEDWKPLQRKHGVAILLSWEPSAENPSPEEQAQYRQHVLRITPDFSGRPPHPILSTSATLALLPVNTLQLTDYESLASQPELCGYMFEIRSLDSESPHLVKMRKFTLQEERFQAPSLLQFPLVFSVDDKRDSPQWPWWITAEKLCLSSGAALGSSVWQNGGEAVNGFALARILYLD